VSIGAQNQQSSKPESPNKSDNSADEYGDESYNDKESPDKSKG
jgi:hypothetical protein